MENYKFTFGYILKKRFDFIIERWERECRYETEDRR